MVLRDILEKNSGFEGESEVAEFITYRRIYVCIVRTAWEQSNCAVFDVLMRV